MLGDPAYPLSDKLSIPYPGKNRPPDKDAFNSIRHSRRTVGYFVEAIAGSVRWVRRPHHRVLPSTQLPPGRAGSAHPSVGRRSRVGCFSPSNDRQQHPTGYFRDDAQEHAKADEVT